jgi:predicted ArsR family transcriptional regulator
MCSSNWQTVADLANRFGVSEQAMRYALIDLRERGIVLQTREGDSGAPGRKPTEYRTESSLSPDLKTGS